MNGFQQPAGAYVKVDTFDLYVSVWFFDHEDPQRTTSIYRPDGRGGWNVETCNPLKKMPEPSLVLPVPTAKSLASQVKAHPADVALESHLKDAQVVRDRLIEAVIGIAKEKRT